MFNLKSLTALAAVVCAALLTSGGGVGSTQSSQAERKVKIREFKDAPVVITEVRNLQKGDDWFRDLEIEVKNTSEAPIYYIHLGLEFPDIPAPPPQKRADGTMSLRTATGISLEYGDTRLENLRKLAAEQDKPLKPGETYVFRVPDVYAKGLENIKRRQSLPPDATNRIELEFSVISFGNGSGFIGGRK